MLRHDEFLGLSNPLNLSNVSITHFISKDVELPRHFDLRSIAQVVHFTIQGNVLAVHAYFNFPTKQFDGHNVFLDGLHDPSPLLFRVVARDVQELTA